MLGIILIGLLFVAPSSTSAQTIVDGDLITTSDSFDIFIVKKKGVKKFKRLILNPAIFESYGHLRWEEVKTVSRATMDGYVLSDLIIEVNPDGSVADPKVYRVRSAPNSDVGERQWLNITAEEFETIEYDWDSLYYVNHTEASPYFYPTKTPLTFQDIVQEQTQIGLSIISITPNQVSNEKTTNIVITGTKFQAGVSVKVGTDISATNVNVVSSTTITATIPQGMSSGIYDIIVTNPANNSDTLINGLSVIASTSLSITNVEPSEILNNIDTFITINGTGFKEGANVYVGGQLSASVTVLDNETISAKVFSTSLPVGIYSVQVVNRDGLRISLSNSLSVVLTPTPIYTGTTLTIEELTAMMAPSMVQIKNDVLNGTGSGFIIDSAGNILTNHHVIKDDSVVDVKLNNGQIVSGTVMGWDEIKDMAVVKIDATDLASSTLGDSDIITLGEKVVALGFPLTVFPGNLTVLEGSIANINKIDSNGVAAIQTNASIQPGSSGGPMLNMRGEVIGINTYCELALFGVCPSGWGHAVKINEVKPILNDLKSGVTVVLPNTTNPTLFIASPVDTVVSGTVTITESASDDEQLLLEPSPNARTA